MYVILLGAPGTGKGTQAKRLADQRGWTHLSTGDMLREEVAAGSEVGQEAKAYMDAGSLVPDDLVVSMLVGRLARSDEDGRFLLDGFPRNVAQAIALDQALATRGKAIDLALNISVPDEELVRRLGGRWICRNCGAIYQAETNPPRELGRCDRCGGELYQRADDGVETVRARLESQKPPADLLAHYRDRGKLVEINGAQYVENVTQDIIDALQTAGAADR